MSYVRVSILGATGGGEVWSINPVFDPTGEFPGPVNQSNLDAAATAIGVIDPGTLLKAFMSSLLTITGARVEVRDDATDDLLAISVATNASVITGTSTPKCPPQTSLVMSLRTNTPGASGRGRLYWPALGAGLQTNGRIDITEAQTAANNFKTYLNAMRSALATNFPTIGFDTAVRSRTTKSTPHVVRLQVGNVLDTQRRRRDHLPEAYASASLP